MSLRVACDWFVAHWLGVESWRNTMFLTVFLGTNNIECLWINGFRASWIYILTLKSMSIGFFTRFSEGKNWLLDWRMSASRRAGGQAGVNNSSERNSSYIFQWISTKLSHKYCNQVLQRILLGFFDSIIFHGITALCLFICFCCAQTMGWEGWELHICNI